MVCWFGNLYFFGSDFRGGMKPCHFQTIRKLANTDFQYHKGVTYSIYQYILTQKCVFPSWKEFYIDLYPFSCLIIGRFCPLFKCLLNFRAYALQFKLNKVGYTNFALYIFHKYLSQRSNQTIPDQWKIRKNRK